MKPQLKKLKQLDIFPLTAKSNAGIKAFMFLKMENIKTLLQYHTMMSVEYIFLRKYVSAIIVCQLSKNSHSRVLQKEFTIVTGDENSTVLELKVLNDVIKFKIDEFKKAKKFFYFK